MNSRLFNGQISEVGYDIFADVRKYNLFIHLINH